MQRTCAVSGRVRRCPAGRGVRPCPAVSGGLPLTEPLRPPLLAPDGECVGEVRVVLGDPGEPADVTDGRVGGHRPDGVLRRLLHVHVPDPVIERKVHLQVEGWG